VAEHFDDKAPSFQSFAVRADVQKLTANYGG
jgi:hypothetical protein